MTNLGQVFYVFQDTLLFGLNPASYLRQMETILKDKEDFMISSLSRKLKALTKKDSEEDERKEEEINEEKKEITPEPPIMKPLD